MAGQWCDPPAALLAVLLLAGLYFSPLPTIGIMACALLLGMLPRVQWERKSVGVKLLTGATAVVVIGALAAVWVMVSLLGQVSRSIPQLGPLATEYVTIVAGLIVLVLFSITLVSFSYAKYRTLTERLRPGADPYRTGRAEDWIESRIAEITAAQSGNVTLYSGENPFIGTGARDRVWSIAIELNRAHGTGSGWGGRRSRAVTRLSTRWSCTRPSGSGCSGSRIRACPRTSASPGSLPMTMSSARASAAGIAR